MKTEDSSPSPDNLDPIRHLKLDGAFNFRDIGGYSTKDGKRVSWRKLFRSDDLFRLTKSDLEVFNKLGIKTVIDLRTKNEADQRGRFPIANYKIDYYQRSLIDISADHSKAIGDTTGEYIFLRYTEILTQGSPGIKAVFEQICEPKSHPAVFHCAVGKDRTGLIAALALEALGVFREQVLADYELTQLSIDSMLVWLDNKAPVLAQQLRALPPVVMSADPYNLNRVLTWIDDNYQSVTNYLITIGVTPKLLSQLKTDLLE